MLESTIQSHSGRTNLFGVLSWHIWEPRVRLEAKTLFRVRNWERYQFRIDYEHEQVHSTLTICFTPHLPHPVIM